jgi:chemotaxis protein methyltransferase CheR
MEELDIGISGVRKLIQTVKDAQSFDLNIYASTFFKRRVSKIIQQNNLGNLDELIDKLGNQNFFSDFIRQISVEGTEFFRDPGFWRYFRDVLSPLLDRNHNRIKIWIPGCSTGEEVVSMAITLQEAGIYDKCTIIATDINEKIISGSRERAYSHAKLEISENNYKRFHEDESVNLQKYIQTHPHGFTFAPTLFRNINYEIFDDREKSKIRGINVILCRNYFIYFTAQYQEKMLDVFTDCLSQNGYLAIGNKENISFCRDYGNYSLLNEKEKIYKKQNA